MQHPASQSVLRRESERWACWLAPSRTTGRSCNRVPFLSLREPAYPVRNRDGLQLSAPAVPRDNNGAKRRRVVPIEAARC